MQSGRFRRREGAGASLSTTPRSFDSASSIPTPEGKRGARRRMHPDAAKSDAFFKDGAETVVEGLLQ